MEELIAECKKLNGMIKNSIEYKNYVSARNHLRRNEDLEKRLRELYAKNREIQDYSYNAYEETAGLYASNDELLHNPLVDEYIRAESALRRLLKTMLDITAADIIFNYLDEGI